MSEETYEEKSVLGLFAKTTDMALDTFKMLLYLKQIESGELAEFYAMVRRDFAKRLRITEFQDDGSGELVFTLRYKKWYYIPYYLIFRDKKRILSECAVIIAEEYLFKLTGRNVKKGHTDFLSIG